MAPVPQRLSPSPTPGFGAVAPPVEWLLRLEGLAVAALSAWLYARLGASWWLFCSLWLAPDLSMLAYAVSRRAGAHAYNAMHTYLLPALLAACSLPVPRSGLAMACALIWCNHIGVDRLLGYGLKYPAGFGFTHLKSLGKQA